MSMKREEEAGNARDAPPAGRGIETPLDKLADGGFVHHEDLPPQGDV